MNLDEVFLRETSAVEATAEQMANALAADVLSDMLDDEIWQRLGFKKRPKYGELVNRWLRNQAQVAFERRLKLEILLVSLAAHIRVVQEKVDRNIAVPLVTRALGIVVAPVVGRFPDEAEAVRFFRDGLATYVPHDLADGGEGSDSLITRCQAIAADEARGARLAAGFMWLLTFRIPLARWQSLGTTVHVVSDHVDAVDPRYAEVAEELVGSD